MMNIIFNFYHPLYLVTYVLAVINLILSLIYMVRLFNAEDRNRIKSMDRGINSILLVSFFMLFFAFLDPTIGFIRAIFSIARSGPARPEVFANAIIMIFIPLFAIVCLCSFYLVVWFFLRAYHRHLVERNAPKGENMKTLLKIGITIVVSVFIYYQIIFIKWIWTTQIDPKVTNSRLIKKSTPGVDIIATKDPIKIYQDGKVVGEVTDTVKTSGNFVIFKQLCETANLNQHIPFEYKRDKYHIIKVGIISDTEIIYTNAGMEQKNAVLENVFCKKVE